MSTAFCWLCNGLHSSAKNVSRCDSDMVKALNPEGTYIQLFCDSLDVTINDYSSGSIYRASFKARYCPMCGKEI